MAKPRSVDAKLARLQALRREPVAEGHVAEVRQALADRSSLVAAAAAEIAGERGLAELAADLVAAFDRFMIRPAETDRLCLAKIAVVEALNRIEYDGEEVFLRAIRHVQMEPRWGGEEDAAAGLRAHAAFGLVRIAHPDVMILLADLLADPEKVARLAAARALGASGARAAIPLLRFKARTGDAEPEVTVDCLAALMSASPGESLSFVAGFLDSPSDAVREGAAFALAESRRPDALAILQGYWPRVRQGPLQEVVLLAISITRLPAALDFLMEVPVGGERDVALAALSALAVHRHNDALKERVRVAVAGKGDAALQRRFVQKFEAEE
jgi:HEAT repeat protein